ncbi:alpha/beta hydrolase [Streptomyces lydicus]|uniref:Alpha/beta hydrolase n=1 Tax=Streptomyces lydicus TaxID=47763 RepID=A0A3S9YKA9_9ACTN|nr:alpha/beta hydrolase [Streptomyces lydicus]
MTHDSLRDREPLHVTVWDEATPGAPRAVLVHGTMSWGTECFAEQRPLAGRFRLELVDRRGFGDSPDIERSDYTVDADDIGQLLGSGAHLAGHSYGAAAVMLAASARPEAVQSLTLIEPSPLRTAAAHPTATVRRACPSDHPAPGLRPPRCRTPAPAPPGRRGSPCRPPRSPSRRPSVAGTSRAPTRSRPAARPRPPAAPAPPPTRPTAGSGRR